MRRFHQLLFTASLVALSWYAMMAVHEFGHVVGAIVTGGIVERVVLHPLAISRTDVSPNPHPAIVVWLGPLVGAVLPLIVFAILPQQFAVVRNVARFFAGFCLIANGAYIAVGSIDLVGDCGEMVRTGTPLWMMLAFGAVTVPVGLYQWHLLGSLKRFFHDPTFVTRPMAYVAFATLFVLVAVGFAVSPR